MSDIIYPDKLKELAIGEHDDVTTPTKKVVAFGWDVNTLSKRRLAVDANGHLIAKISGTPQSLSTAAINFAASGNHTIVAADASNKIKITTIVLTVRGETDLIFRRGAIDISGAMDFGGTNEPRGIVINHVAFPLETGINEAFIINSSAAVQVSGYVIFYREP